tara:strand:- start:1264 stop:1788 length:525 start_codon:yes stop_codon:yes gene_type:complete
MKWWVFILLPFQLLAQDTYNTCEDLIKTYQVQYDIDKEYYWNIDGGDILSVYDNIITVQWYKDIGQYKISAWTISNGCYGDTSHYYINIIECPDYIYFPSAFTPNGDNKNESYEIKGLLASKIKYMAIYDRWGKQIIESNTNIIWTGDDYPSGVYSIIVLVENKKYIKNIMLVR